jgi:hypothetical protein
MNEPEWMLQLPNVFKPEYVTGYNRGQKNLLEYLKSNYGDIYIGDGKTLLYVFDFMLKQLEEINHE